MWGVRSSSQRGEGMSRRAVGRTRHIVLLHCTVVGADRSSDNSITSAEVQDRRSGRKIHAKAFVDCSGESATLLISEGHQPYGNLGKVNLGPLSTRFGGLQNVSPTAEQ
jgi:hypothetical protein